MRVGFYQFNPIFGEVKQNLDTVFNRLMKVEADLIVLPELCMSGYQFTSKEEVTVLAEEVPHGPTTQRLIALARERSMVIVAGLPERDGAYLYNSAVIVGPSGLIGCYRKTHLFYEETQFFSPGRRDFKCGTLDRRKSVSWCVSTGSIRNRPVRWRSKEPTSFAILRIWFCRIVPTRW